MKIHTITSKKKECMVVSKIGSPKWVLHNEILKINLVLNFNYHDRLATNDGNMTSKSHLIEILKVNFLKVNRERVILCFISYIAMNDWQFLQSCSKSQRVPDMDFLMNVEIMLTLYKEPKALRRATTNRRLLRNRMKWLQFGVN